MPPKDQHSRYLIERDLERFGPTPPSLIRARTAIPRGSIKKMLAELCEAGRIEKVGKGMYRLVPDALAADA